MPNRWNLYYYDHDLSTCATRAHNCHNPQPTTLKPGDSIVSPSFLIYSHPVDRVVLLSLNYISIPRIISHVYTVFLAQSTQHRGRLGQKVGVIIACSNNPRASLPWCPRPESPCFNKFHFYYLVNCLQMNWKWHKLLCNVLCGCPTTTFRGRISPHSATLESIKKQ